MAGIIAQQDRASALDWPCRTSIVPLNLDTAQRDRTTQVLKPTAGTGIRSKANEASASTRCWAAYVDAP